MGGKEMTKQGNNAGVPVIEEPVVRSAEGEDGGRPGGEVSLDPTLPAGIGIPASAVNGRTVTIEETRNDDSRGVKQSQALQTLAEQDEAKPASKAKNAIETSEPRAKSIARTDTRGGAARSSSAPSAGEGSSRAAIKPAAKREKKQKKIAASEGKATGRSRDPKPAFMLKHQLFHLPRPRKQKQPPPPPPPRPGAVVATSSSAVALTGSPTKKRKKPTSSLDPTLRKKLLDGPDFAVLEGSISHLVLERIGKLEDRETIGRELIDGFGSGNGGGADAYRLPGNAPGSPQAQSPPKIARTVTIQEVIDPVTANEERLVRVTEGVFRGLVGSVVEGAPSDHETSDGTRILTVNAEDTEVLVRKQHDKAPDSPLTPSAEELFVESLREEARTYGIELARRGYPPPSMQEAAKPSHAASVEVHDFWTAYLFAKGRLAQRKEAGDVRRMSS